MVPYAIARYARGREKQVSSVVYLPDMARAMGVLVAAGKGSGKSRLMGRVICLQDFLKGRAQVIIDPNGPTIDNLLDSIRRLPEPQRTEALKRLVYVDMSGRDGHIMAWPLYYRYQGESLYEAAVRLIEVIRRLDPALTSASIEGFNAISEVGINAGMVAVALSWQITQVSDLIVTPERYTRELQWVAATYPEAGLAANYFLSVLPSLKPAEKERKVGAFLRKIAVFSLEPTLQAMVAAHEPRIDWEAVISAGKTVLLDFRGVLDAERRRFLMLWVFREFLTYIKRRGAGRHTPVGLVVDELTALYNFDAQAGSTIFATDLDELINVLARNYNVWLLLALQELFQVDEKSRKTLLAMGTKIIGVTTDSEAALTLARAFIPYDPTLIKHFDPVYDMRGTIVDFTPRYWSIEEQQLLAAQAFQTLKPFHFLVKVSEREGDVTGHLQPLSIANREQGVWVDEVAVTRLRGELAAQSGVPVRVLAPPVAPTVQVEDQQEPSHEDAEHDKLELYEPADTDDVFSFREEYDPNTY